MSYFDTLKKQRRLMARSRSAQRSMRPALGDIVSDLSNIFGGPIAGQAVDFAGSSANTVGGCVTDADASSTVSELDARTEDLAKNWKPTGFYTPAQVDQIVGQVQSVLGSVVAALVFAPRSTSDADFAIRQAGDEIARKGAAAQVYSDAAADARSKGGVVDAAGLKRWVTDSLTTASQGLVTVQALQCDRTWIGSVLSSVANVWATAWSVIKQIAGTIADATKYIAKVPDVIETLLTLGKWAIILGGGTYIVLEIKKRQRAGRPA